LEAVGTERSQFNFIRNLGPLILLNCWDAKAVRSALLGPVREHRRPGEGKQHEEWCVDDGSRWLTGVAEGVARTGEKAGTWSWARGP